MATIEDSTDPRGTQRPKEDPIHQSAHTFKPVIIIERPCKVCLPSNIQPNDVYAIFSLFFSDAVLDVLIKSTNAYGAQHYKQLKATWQNTSRTELRAFLEVLIYRSLYPLPKHKDYWNINPQNPIHIGLTNALSRDRFSQLEASIHISDLEKPKGDIFSKLEPVNTMLLDTCKTL